MNYQTVYSIEKLKDELSAKTASFKWLINTIYLFFTNKRYSAAITEKKKFLLVSSISLFRPVNIFVFGKVKPLKTGGTEMSFYIIPNIIPFAFLGYITYRISLLYLSGGFTSNILINSLILLALLILMIFSFVDERKNLKEFLYGQLLIKEKVELIE